MTRVPGDVVRLSAGTLIPADGRVLKPGGFLAPASAMTGAARKSPGAATADAPVTARTNGVFIGASVRSSAARVLAVCSGKVTCFGKKTSGDSLA